MNAPSDAEHGHVVVAVDGSQAADNAVDWAADEAALRGIDLEVLHAWQELRSRLACPAPLPQGGRPRRPPLTLSVHGDEQHRRVRVVE
jgi:nucleotide-binding universal stress UspA family protein